MSRTRRSLRAALLASIALSTLAIPAIIVLPSTPALAQGVAVSAGFRTALESYGAWHHHRQWGDVWVPAHISRDWRPYTLGHWVYSDDYGWYWVSDEEEASWGLVVYHYGRWVEDDELGWAWVPGTEWGPSWVSWRRGREHAGWAPLPPDELVVEYRNRPTDWVFVRTRDLVAPHIAQVLLPPRERDVYIRDTVVVNRTVVVSDQRFAVNPGIPPTYVAAAYGRPIPAYQIRPHVFAGTSRIDGAVELRPNDLRDPDRSRQIASQTVTQQTRTTIQPARQVPPPQALGANENGRLGEHAPRAAQGAAAPGSSTTGSGAAMPQTGERNRRGERLPGNANAPSNAPGSANAPANTNAPQQSRDQNRERGRDGRIGNAPSDRTLGAGRQNGRSKQTEGAGAPGTTGAGAAGETARQPAANARRGAQDKLNEERGRLSGHAQDKGQDRGAAPQTSGQGPTDRALDRGRGRDKGNDRSSARPERAPSTSGSGLSASEPRSRGGEPRGERSALPDHGPQTTGAGSPEPRGRPEPGPATRSLSGPAAGPSAAPSRTAPPHVAPSLDRGGPPAASREAPRAPSASQLPHGGPATTGAAPPAPHAAPQAGPATTGAGPARGPAPGGGGPGGARHPGGGER